MYRPWSLRNLTTQSVRHWFCGAGGEFVLRHEYRRGAQFRDHNLVSETFPGAGEDAAGFDAIMCCNVMIYFDAEINLRLARQFRQALRPGGILLIGHADFAPALSGILKAEHISGALVYRRPYED